MLGPLEERELLALSQLAIAPPTLSLFGSSGAGTWSFVHQASILPLKEALLGPVPGGCAERNFLNSASGLRKTDQPGRVPKT